MLGGGCSGIPAHFPLLRHVATFSFLNSSTLLTHINKFIKMFKLLGKSQLEKAVLVLTLLLLAAGHQCGNGLKERGENCDDGNAQSQDGCDSRCWIEQGYHCPIPGARCLQAAVCGDEKQDFPTEQCVMVTRMMEMGAVRPAKSNPDFSAGEPGASGSVETESSAHSLSKLENSVMTGTTMTEMGVVASANRKMDLPARLCLANRCVS